MDKTVTRKDVARVAGVSESTVSVALHGSKTVRISEETRMRILAVAKEIGYVPNNAARTISGHKSHNIGVLSPWTASVWYFAYMLDGITSIAVKRNYGVLLTESLKEDEQEPEGCIRFFREGRFDGVIYLPPTTVKMPGLSALRNAEIPTIICNGIDPYGDMDFVVMDYAFGIAKAARYLYSLSFKKLLYVFPGEYDLLCSGDLDRYTGFQQVKALPNIELHTRILNPYVSPAEGVKKAEQILSEVTPPVGVIGAYYIVANYMQIAAQRLGLVVGKDIVIISGDSPPDLMHLNLPPIKGISLPFFDIGQAAAERLIDRLEDQPLSPGNSKLVDNTEY